MVEIIFVDSHLVAAVKPAGLLTHPSSLSPSDHDSLLLRLRRHLGQRVYPVHRLDRATSGIIIMGRTPSATAALGAAMAERRIQKTYLAVVRGYLQGQGAIDKPLLDQERRTPVPACTHWHSLALSEHPWPVRPFATTRLSLLALRPITGRMHQLRKHLHSQSHPIIGDRIYGDGAHNKSFAQMTGVKRLLLHAYSLEFPHPISDQRLNLIAPLDHDFATAISHFKDKAVCPSNIAANFRV